MNLSLRGIFLFFLKGKKSIYNENFHTTGGYISGDVKVSITLRLFSGGDALDIVVIVDVSPTHYNDLFYDILLNLIIKTNIGALDMMKYLEDEQAITKVSAGFSRRSVMRITPIHPK